MTTRVYILFLFLTAIMGIISFDIISGHSYDVLTDKVYEANQNLIVIEEIEHIQKHLPLLMIVADLIIGSSETYLQDDALQEIIMLKQQLDNVADYPLVKTKPYLLDEINMQLDIISSQIEQASEVIKFRNAEKLSILLNEFDNTSIELIKTLNLFHENSLILVHDFDTQLLIEKEKQKLTIYSAMALLLLIFYFFTRLALRNIDSPIRLMTEAANNSLRHGEPYTANIKG